MSTATAIFQDSAEVSKSSRVELELKRDHKITEGGNNTRTQTHHDKHSLTRLLSPGVGVFLCRAHRGAVASARDKTMTVLHGITRYYMSVPLLAGRNHYSNQVLISTSQTGVSRKVSSTLSLRMQHITHSGIARRSFATEKTPAIKSRCER